MWGLLARRTSACCCLTLFTVLASAQDHDVVLPDGPPIDLPEALARAMTRNPELVAFGYRNISIHLVGFYDATSDCMCWLRLVINVKTAVATGRQINRLPLAWRHV